MIHARETGQGQVIDCAMSDGAASLMAMFYGFKAAGVWSDERRANLLDGGAHFYDTYQCADGKWISIGSIEPQFYALLLEKTGITDPEFAGADGPRRAGRSCATSSPTSSPPRPATNGATIMDGTDVCFAPVLEPGRGAEASAQRRAADLRRGGRRRPARAGAALLRDARRDPGPPPAIGAHTREALADWGLDPATIERRRGAPVAA